MKDNITDWALNRHRTVYKDDSITKEDIFYYIYGILHHKGYRQKYRRSLVKALPRIPMAADFWAFSKAGRNLANLHLNYETGPRYDLGKPLKPIPDQPKKIRFGKKPNPEFNDNTTDDFATLIIDGITVYDNLPKPDYKVNRRTPIQWFATAYSFDRNKKNGITNWPLGGTNSEQVRAIIERLVYVGVESDKIINSLPAEFMMDDIEPEPVGLDKYTKAAV